MKKFVFAVFILGLGFMLSGCGEREKPLESRADVGIYGSGRPVTRGEAARMLALCLYDAGELYSFEETAEFSDITQKDRLFKYVNALYSAGVMSGDGQTFRPGDYLTVGEAEIIIKNADKSGRLSIDMNDEAEENPISYYIWSEILTKMNEAGDFSGLNTGGGFVLKAGSISSELEGYDVLDCGLFNSDGFLGEDLEDLNIEFLSRDDCIIAVLSVKSHEGELKGCLVLGLKNGEAEVFVKGVKKTWRCDLTYEGDLPFCGDIRISGGSVGEIDTFATEKEGRLISAGSGIILFDDGYSYNMADDFTVYHICEGISCGGAERLVSGESIRVMFKDNIAVCGICSEKPRDDIIRIALAADKGGLVHKEVSLGADSGFTLGEGEFDGGTDINLTGENKSSFFGGKLTTLKAVSGKIKIDGREYEGTADIIVCEGGFWVVLETDLEYYLYGVVCAEMPPSYGEEALKAQAVAARSYAYNQKTESRRTAYGANVDDTVAFQAFNPECICDESINAVDKTKGEVLTYDGNVINACFYSTSCGIGANSGEVWGKNGILPWITPEYLKSRVIGEGEAPDLSSEETALNFFKKTDDKAYERDFPYYRWSIAASPYDFAAQVGAVDSVEVIRRGEGGNVMEVLIEGDEADESVIGEGNVRRILKNVRIKLNDGSTADLESLPSAFFAAEEIDGTIYFYGGGCGHGAGMSQNGAKSLAEKGLSYKEITAYFYKGTEIKKLKHR